MEVASFSRNGDGMVFDLERDAESQFILLANNTDQTITVFPKFVNIESTPDEPLIGSSGGETGVISCQVNDKMALFGFCSTDVSEFKENSLTYMFLGVEINQENESASTGELDRHLCESAALEAQKLIQPVEFEKDVGNGKEENNCDDQTTCSDGHEQIGETDEMKSEIHKDSNFKLPDVSVLLEDLFPSHLRKLGKAHSNMGLCACIYCCGEYNVSNGTAVVQRHSSDLQQPSKNLRSRKRQMHFQNFKNNFGKRQNNQKRSGAKTYKKVQNNKKPLQHDKCSSKLKGHNTLNVQLKVHSPENYYRCKFCGKQSKLSSSLHSHFKEHNVIKPFKCEECAVKFCLKSTLRIHVQRLSNKKPNTCAICLANFKCKYYLKVHLRRHRGDKPYKCKLCSSKFTQKGEVNNHMKSVHNNARPFECKLCHAKFKSIGNLNEHKRVHNDVRPFECQLCHAKFKSISNLNGHQIVHNNKRPYECKLCHAKFKSINTLNAHKRVHSDEKPFECKTCHAKFKQRFGLKSHLLVHSEQKPFKCGHCPAKFLRKIEVSAHLKIHSLKYRFVCTQCPSSFQLKNSLGHHLKKYH